MGEVPGTEVNTPHVGPSHAPGTSPPCGDPAVWANGYPGTIPPNYPRNGFGLSACCGGLLDLPGHPALGLLGQASEGNFWGDRFWSGRYWSKVFWP